MNASAFRVVYKNREAVVLTLRDRLREER